jgi:hypothetical protein
MVNRMEPRQIAKALAASVDDDLASAIATLREAYAFKANVVVMQDENRSIPGTPDLDAEIVTACKARVEGCQNAALDGVFVSDGSEITTMPVELPDACNQFPDVIKLATTAGSNEALATMVAPQCALVAGVATDEDKLPSLFGGIRLYIPDCDSAGPLRGYVKYAELALRPALFNLCKRKGDTSLYVEFDRCPWCGDPGASWPAYYSACRCPPMRMFPTFHGERSRLVAMAAFRADDSDFVSHERSGAWEMHGEWPEWDPGASVCMSELREWDRDDGDYGDIEPDVPDSWIIRKYLYDRYSWIDYGDPGDYFVDYELMGRLYDRIRRLQGVLRTTRWGASSQFPFCNIKYSADCRITWQDFASGWRLPDKLPGVSTGAELSEFESMVLATIYYTGCEVKANWDFSKGRWQCQVLIPLVRCSGYGTGRSKIGSLFDGIFKAWYHFYRKQLRWESAYIRLVCTYGDAELLRNDIRAVYFGFKRARLPHDSLSNLCRRQLTSDGEVVMAADDIGHFPLVFRDDGELEGVVRLDRVAQQKRWSIPRNGVIAKTKPKKRGTV